MSILPGATVYSKHGHLRLHKTKMATTIIPNRGLQNSGPQTNGWRRDTYTEGAV